MPRMRQRRGRAAGRTKRGPSLPGRERRRVERYVARRLRREERSVHPCVDEARRRRDSLDGEDGLALVVDAQKRCAGVVDRPEPFFGVAACQFRQVARRLDQDLPLLDDDEARRGRRPEHGHLLSILAQVRHSVDGRWQRSAPVLVRAQFLAKPTIRWSLIERCRKDAALCVVARSLPARLVKSLMFASRSAPSDFTTSSATTLTSPETLHRCATASAVNPATKPAGRNVGPDAPLSARA
mmetsp:Transcript_17749/g.60967  ORF Transcript_17749/g.60967 Transcript_17749/m.60967 type:complete len:240 (+) Transcript_17749:922-1641(+)